MVFFVFYKKVLIHFYASEQYSPLMFTTEQYSKFLLDNYNKYGIYETPVIERTRPDVICGAAKKNFFCISSEGLVYKCPSRLLIIILQAVF